MQKRKRRGLEQRDMITLGGWLFADLLLGLALFFFAANTTGSAPPTPVPTATPNLLATEQARAGAEIAAANLAATEAAQTAEALNAQVSQSDAALATAAARATQDALLRQQATATAQALATRAALSADARATVDAQATQDAFAAEATIAAFATEQAESSAAIASLTREQATAAALATQNAEAAAIATENAQSGANDLATAQAQAAAAQATIEAQAANQILSGSQLATAQAEAAAIQATVAALSTEQAAAAANATALSAELVANSLDPSARESSITTDINGMISGNPEVLNDAREQLQEIIAPYQNGCRAGVVLISGNGDLGPGNDLARVVEGLLRDDYPAIFTEETGYERFAQPGAQPTGGVNIKVYFNTGCQGPG